MAAQSTRLAVIGRVDHRSLFRETRTIEHITYRSDVVVDHGAQRIVSRDGALAFVVIASKFSISRHE